MYALTVLSPRRSVSNPSLPSVEAFQIPMLGGKARAPYQTAPAPFHAVPQPVRIAILEKEVPACAHQERTWHAGLVSGLIATGCSPAPRSNLSLLSLTSPPWRAEASALEWRFLCATGLTLHKKHGLMNAVFDAASSVLWWDGL